jgi:hypothetical protein
MATYLLTAPDGKKYRVTGEGTGEDALAQLQSQLGEQIKPEQKYNELQSGVAGAAQGATAEFGDEIMAGLTAGGMKALDAVDRGRSAITALPVAALTDKTFNQAYEDQRALKTDKSFGQLYEQERNKIGAENKIAAEENPVSYGTGYVGGVLGSSIGTGLTTGGKLVYNSVGRGLLPQATGKLGQAANFGTKMLQSGAVTGAAGALAAAGGAEPGERLDAAVDSVPTNFSIGAALPVAGALIGGVAKEVKSLAPKSAQSSSALRAAAKPHFDNFTQSGATYSPALTDEIAQLATAAKSTGIAGVSKQADDALNQTLDFYAGLKGKALSPADIQKLDQSFADDIARFNRAGEYNFGRILNDLKYEFRNRAFDPQNAANYVTGGSPQAVDELVKGNALWSQSYKANDVEKILQKAKGTENPQTSIRTGLKNLLANDKKMARYSDAEKKALEEALKRGFTGGTIKLFGGRLTDSVAGGMAGLSAGGPVGAIAGTIAGKAVGGGMANVAGGVQANRLRGALRAIQSGVPAKTGGSSISPMLSAPAGGVTGAINNSQAVPVRPNLSTPIRSNQPRADNFDYLDNIKMAESGGDPSAQNPNSTASGLYQFTDQTWKDTVAKYGAEDGVTADMKNNPEAQEKMVRRLAADNANILTRQLDKEPSVGDMYAAHFLGANDAVKLIKWQGSRQIAANLFPKAAQANKSIFYDRGRPRTVEEVYQTLSSKVA